ncbi:MAG: FdhF/YdeP family oxidoreductase [Pseudomonadales bacterium]|nr:FdhF/YdeP family oxidoreductase [Pseudomonadales bacterium]NNM10761.1 FdhF/YdeP family oxidoreductase [Pseudomonadales bacterium]RZV57421.1 MAG: FdhF/YdeP family oxidoreductase [Pseudomonadales bacterium]
MSKAKTPVGGGAKKILYTLRTASRIGLLDSARALSAKNTCKACGLGMGGQRGGMTNEQGEFPSVCNKSVQAQSTDIQQPIPLEVFQHSLEEFKQLSAHELEHMGRLGTPLYKSAAAERYSPIDWDTALQRAANAFARTQASRSFFYSSGRSSNEAGFVLQLLARVYGSNNVNNCSYYCHQATGVGLANTIGSGTATVELADLDACDTIFVIGANPASNHPRFIHKLKACRDRGGHVIVINPAREPGLVKFALPKSARSLIAGGSEIASHYLQPQIGSDVAVLHGLAKATLELGAEDRQFIEKHCNDFGALRKLLESLSWPGIEQACGLGKSEIFEVARVYARAENAVFAWGMGITHHASGVANVECISNLALLRGMLGAPSRGLLPLRGHSNVQGIGTIGVKPVLASAVFEKMQSSLGVDMPAGNETGMDTLACLEAAASGNIDAALIMGGNLYAGSPNAKWAEAALDAIGCKVFLTTTLNKSHVCGVGNGEVLILPVAARDEEPQPTTQESMFNFVRLSDGGIKRIAQARSEIDVLVDIARRLSANEHFKKNLGEFDFSVFSSRSNIRETIARVIPGMQALADIDVAKREFHVQNRIRHTPVFATADQRANFIAQPMQVFQSSNEFPYKLMSVRSEGQFNSIIYEQQDSYRGAVHRQVVFLNREDMRQLGISNGAIVALRSAYGRMPDLRAQGFDLPRGNVMAYYPEANILIGTERDARSQTPAFKSVSVALELADAVA